MQIKDKVTVITGAGRGIGAELARRFAREGARAVVITDLDGDLAEQVAKECGGVGLGLRVDVSQEAEIQKLVQQVTAKFGQIDLFCSNAGIMRDGGIDASNEQWQQAWDVNFMSHVYAARAVIPAMLERGNGYLLQTASAAGLLTQIGAAPYSVTKHAAVAYAEWLSITYQRQGLRVSCLCPQGVHTRMLDDSFSSTADLLRTSAVTVEQVADAVIEGLGDERFLILPHPEVATYFQNRANNNERWLAGMRKLWEKAIGIAKQATGGDAI